MYQTNARAWRVVVRSIFLFLLSSSALPLAAQERQPVSVNEIGAGLRLSPTGRPRLSSDARWMFFYTNKGQGLADFRTGEKTNVAESWMVGGQEWSPRDVQTTGLYVHREGKLAIALWPVDSRKIRELLVIPRDLYAGVSPLWSPDGGTVFFVINQHLPWPKSHPADDHPPTESHNVSLRLTAPYRDKQNRERFAREYPEAYAEQSRSLILALDVASGRLGLVAKGNDIDYAGLQLSPDGRRLVAVQLKVAVPDKPLQWTKQFFADLYLIDVPAPADRPAVDLESLEDRRAGWSDAQGRRLFPFQTDAHLANTMCGDPPGTPGTCGNPALSWSPDSRHLAYATVGRQATGDVFVYEAATEKLRNLTAEVTLQDSGKSLGYGDHYTWTNTSLKFGNVYPPMWLPDGSALLCLARGDAWLVSLNSRQAPRKLTQALPREVRRILPSRQYNIAAVDETGRILVAAKEKLSRLDSLWKVDWRSGAVSKQADLDVWANWMAVDMDARGEHLVYIGHGPNALDNIHRLDLRAPSRPELFTRYQMELPQRQYPEMRVLQWEVGGRIAYGLLHLPADASAARKAPMILKGYPGEPYSRLDMRMRPGAGYYDDELHGLLQSGFAVFYPDIPMSDEGVYEAPMRQMVDGVMAATDAVLATGLIDENRIGIFGGSYGGFMVQAVITRTARFKAAVSMAGGADWFADYLRGGALLGTAYHHSGQGRFGKPLWEDPVRYMENSPIIHWDKVHTPLLIIHGAEDPSVPVAHAEESFAGLNQLGRPAIFARYHRMGHAMAPEAARRVRGWLQEQLLGKSPMTPIADQGSFFLGGDWGDE